MRLRLSFAVGAALVLCPQLAMAQGADYVPLPSQPELAQPPLAQPAPRYAGFDPAARDAWLADCRQKVAYRDAGRSPRRDSGLGGALIGGAAGAIAGNRIAGQGNRTEGTLIGAGLGAVAGYAIDRAEDSHTPPPEPPRDECEAYLADYYQRYTSGNYGAYYTQAAYAGGSQPHCTETIEYVYEDVPAPARRTVPARPRPAPRATPDKRVPIVPEKRVPVH